MDENIKIMVVEDESVAAINIKQDLESFGFNVPYIASHGEEAIEKVLEIKPDLILMDIVLKGEINGIDVASKINKLDIPVIYLTAYSDEFKRNKAKFTAPYAYITKPYDTNELKYAIGLALYKHGMEKELKKSEKKYRELVDNSLVGIFKTNLQGDILFANEALVELFEVENKDEINSNKSLSFYKDIQERKELIEKLMEEGAGQFELEMITKTGKLIHVLCSAKLSDQIITGMLIDISPLKEAEEELHHSNKWLGFAQKAAKSGFWDWDMLTEKLTWSPEFYELFGLPTDAEASFDTWTDLLHPDDVEGAMATINRSIEEHNFLENEYRVIKPDGEEIWVGAWGSTLYEGDKPVRMSGICMDITPRKTSEKTIENQYLFLQELINSINHPIFYKDVNYVYLGCNRAFEGFIGLNREEIIGKTVYDISPKDLADKYHQKDKELMEGGNLQIYEAPVRYADGSKHMVLFNKSIFFDTEGNAAGLIGIMVDITEQKEAEDQIKRSLEEKDVLLREIHHRVKNNLQIISSLLNLQSYTFKDPTVIDILQQNQNRIKSMAMIHEKLYRSPELSRIDFTDYIRSLSDAIFHSYAAIKANVALKTDMDDNIMLNIETAIPCGLIISELLSNSIKHAFPQNKKGEICINFKQVGDLFTILVKDNGIGFPDELDFKNTESLGLQLVNSLVGQLEGKIELDRSEGTTFKITFQELEYQSRV